MDDRTWERLITDLPHLRELDRSERLQDLQGIANRDNPNWASVPALTIAGHDEFVTYDEYVRLLGAKLRHLHEGVASLTLNSMSELTGIGGNMVSKVERGEGTYSLRLLLVLAEIFDLGGVADIDMDSETIARILDGNSEPELAEAS